MEKFSKKERLEIYYKILNFFLENQYTLGIAYQYGVSPYICDNLDKYIEFHESTLNCFPEFELFEPTIIDEINHGDVGWWETRDIQSRIFALEFCIQMCK